MGVFGRVICFFLKVWVLGFLEFGCLSFSIKFFFGIEFFLNYMEVGGGWRMGMLLVVVWR